MLTELETLKAHLLALQREMERDRHNWKPSVYWAAQLGRLLAPAGETKE